MTVRQVAEKIGISPSLVYALVQAGIIRHSRHGRPGKRGCIRISEDALAEYLERCERSDTVAEGDAPLRHLR